MLINSRCFELLLCWLILTTCSALTASSAHAGEQTQTGTCASLLENRRVDIVIAQTPGGGYHQYAQIIADLLEQTALARVAVKHVTGAGGRLARRYIASSDDSNLSVGLFNSDDYILADSLEDDIGADQFYVLGVVIDEIQGWVSKQPLAELLSLDRALVAGTTNIRENVLPVAMPAYLLDKEVRMVGGYTGSADLFASLRRDEIDMTRTSLSTLLRAIEGAELHVALLIGQEPQPQLPGTPYLAGPNGVIDQLTATLSESQRQQRMQMAADIVSLSRSRRMLFASRKISAETHHCLQTVFNELLFSAEFAEAAAALRRDITPVGAAEASEILAADLNRRRRYENIMLDLFEKSSR